MRGFTHFLDDGGKSSILDEGPWHYGVNYLAVYFKAQPERLSKILPDQLEVGDGTGIACVCDFVSVSESKPDVAYSDPAQATYTEAGVGIWCSFQGRRGVYFPYLWVNRDWAMIRGWILGFPKKIADQIELGKIHPLNPLTGPMGPGRRISGYCVRHGERLLTVGMSVGHRGSKDDVMGFGSVYGLRHFPVSGGDGASVNEIVEVERKNLRLGDEVWVGDGELTLGGGVNDRLDCLNPFQTLYACQYSVGFTNTVTKRLLQ